MSNKILPQTSPPPPSLKQAVKQGIDKERDSQVAQFINDGDFRSIYELLLDLAYVLFTAAITLTISYDAEFGQSIKDYTRQSDKRELILTKAVIGVVILAALRFTKIFSQ